MANPNPSPETRFQPGGCSNPGGKTSAHRKAEVEAAEIAARVALKMVKAVEGKIEEMETAVEDGATKPDANAALNAVKADILRLMKDVQDRAFGTPTQPILGPGPNGEHLMRTQSTIDLTGFSLEQTLLLEEAIKQSRAKAED